MARSESLESSHAYAVPSPTAVRVGPPVVALPVGSRSSAVASSTPIPRTTALDALLVRSEVSALVGTAPSCARRPMNTRRRPMRSRATKWSSITTPPLCASSREGTLSKLDTKAPFTA
eukprot:CAMPEP_0171895810 /NCGR_PEP_ID=MMETSP0992-20121227/47243_1 /TAXON_ID=483369 /ORGANISM="non described non described, Strain CCMP2098" /LENGTH=117 /DNA_ID=CAMNT_0012523781 /DNA_START=295 /DNA_END=645 /DNA_ORIENTATION=+